MKTKNEILKVLSAMRKESKLHEYVINDILDHATEYSGTFVERLKGRLEDVLHGLSTGIVGQLVYTSDTTAFFDKYKTDIVSLLRNESDSIGESFGEYLEGLRDWDKDDPFCEDSNNKTICAWASYEIIAEYLYGELDD